MGEEAEEERLYRQTLAYASEEFRRAAEDFWFQLLLPIREMMSRIRRGE